jgi:hypothetical protein
MLRPTLLGAAMFLSMTGACSRCSRTTDVETRPAADARLPADAVPPTDGAAPADAPSDAPISPDAGARLTVASSLASCLGQASPTVVSTQITDPHGQGELLGIGVRLQLDPKRVSELARIDRIELASARLKGEAVNNLAIRTHTLQGMTSAGSISEPAWVGAEFTGTLHCINPRSDGSTWNVTLRIVRVTPTPVEAIDTPPSNPPTSGKRPVYQLEIDLDANNHHVPACSRHRNNNAIPIPGHWDEQGAYVPDTTMFSFACLEAGAPLCLRWGTTDEGATETYQACARMMRADYCGDGKSHTLEGTLVKPLKRGDPTSTANDPGHFEAAWRPDGALCRDHVRWRGDGETCDNGHQVGRCSRWDDLPASATVFVNGSCLNPDPPAPGQKCVEVGASAATSAGGGAGSAARPR